MNIKAEFVEIYNDEYDYYSRDINEDNTVDSKDVSAILKVVSESTELNFNQLMRCDINENGKVSILDAIALLNELQK